MATITHDEEHRQHTMTLDDEEIIILRLAEVLIRRLLMLTDGHDCEALSLDGDRAADIVELLPEF